MLTVLFIHPMLSQSYSYDPTNVDLNGWYYDETISFYAYAYPSQHQMTGRWEFKVSVENATIVGYGTSQTFFGTNIQFKVRLTANNVQAKVTGTWIYNNVSIQTRYWKINVRKKPTMYIDGPSEITATNNGAFYIYTANYSNHNSSAKYAWTTDKPATILYQGTQRIGLRTASEGVLTLTVTADGISATKRIVVVPPPPPCGVTKVSDLSITSNKSYENCGIVISNINIKNNAVVNFTAKDSIVIKSNFIAEKGTTVTFKTTGHELRNMIIEDIEQNDIMSSDLDLNQTQNTNPTTISVKVYSTMGTLIHSSFSDIDIYSLGFNNGIYIIEKTDEFGGISREKIFLKSK